MGGQGVDRREALRIMALAAAAGQFSGFSRWVFGGESSPEPGGTSVIRAAAYQPQFFTPPEYRLVERLTELIVPSDDTLGAREAGVSEFVDFMAAHDPAIQIPFRDGLRWLEAHALRLFASPFLELTEDHQSEILARLAYRNRYRLGEEEGQAFFRLIRRYTVMGFYTSRIGMEELDAPALRHVYPDSPACPHPDDPEHRNLKPQF